MAGVVAILLLGLGALAAMAAKRGEAAEAEEKKLIAPIPTEPKKTTVPIDRRRRQEKLLVKLIETGNRKRNPVYLEKASDLAEKMKLPATAEATMRRADDLRRQRAIEKRRSVVKGTMIEAARRAHALGDDEAAAEALAMAKRIR